MIQPPKLTPSANRAIPWWLTTIVIIGALLAAAGAFAAIFRPEMLLGSGQTMNDAANVYAGYLVSRGLAVAVMLVALLALGARRLLAGLMVFTALLQLIDAVVDLVEGRLFLLPVLLIYTIAFLIGANWLFGQPFWKASAWQDGRLPHLPAAGDSRTSH